MQQREIAVRASIKRLQPALWRRLALPFVLVIYVLFFVLAVKAAGVLNGPGGDYLAYWSAGKIADHYGFRQVYNLELFKVVQDQVMGGSLAVSENNSVIPVAYLAIFVLPFKFLSRLDPHTGYWLWIAFNALAISGYLFFFLSRVSQKLGVRDFSRGWLFFLLLSPTVMTNLYMGQVGIALIICSGEFIRAAISDRPWLCGLWLGGLMLKPPILVLVLPAVLLLKNWKVLGGFSLSSISTVLLSTLLAGWQGMLQMVNLWLGKSSVAINNNQGFMVNWRMLGANINQIFSTSAGWWVTGLGMAVSLVIWWRLWRKNPTWGSCQWITTLMGIFATSCAFTWHSHIHMMTVILPFLLYSAICQSPPGVQKGIETWVVGTPIVLILAGLVSVLIHQEVTISVFTGLLIGLSGLVFYLYVALAALRSSATA